MKVPYESGMGLIVTIVSSIIELQQATQKPGVPSTRKSRSKKTGPVGRKLCMIFEGEGKLPRTQGK